MIWKYNKIKVDSMNYKDSIWYKIERFFDRHNHLMEFIRTILADLAISETLVVTVGFVLKNHIIRSSREVSKPILRSRHAENVFCVSKTVQCQQVYSRSVKYSQIFRISLQSQRLTIHERFQRHNDSTTDFGATTTNDNDRVQTQIKNPTLSDNGGHPPSCRRGTQPRQRAQDGLLGCQWKCSKGVHG